MKLKMQTFRRRQEESLWLRLCWMPLCLLSLLLTGGWFWLMYTGGSYPRRWLIPAALFTLGWSLGLTALGALLPRIARRCYLAVLGLALFLLTLTHGIYFNMFRKFFSFSDMAFAGDGFAFLDSSYLVVRKLSLLLGLLSLGVMALAAFAVTAEKDRRRRLFAGLGGLLLSALVVGGTAFAFLRGGDTMIWDMSADPAVVYESFNDTKASMRLLGLYQFTFRDLQLALFPGGETLDEEELQEIDAYAAGRSHEDNEMTGLLEGKNLILVQLEAIDTWMVDYMPNLQKVKEESIVFSNHYTPAYITAGTFNTEFMVNAGLLPAASGTPVSVYTRNAFPASLPSLFREKGYTANSFHGSEAGVYNRGAIHENLGYEVYHSGSDMGMEDYTMDSQLIGAFDDMTMGDPFFTFIITYSGHGPYSDSNPIYLAHAEEAQAAAARTDGNYVYAVGHAMETDVFVGELMEALEASGHAQDTAVVFYADHYNYYMLDDGLNMDIKGVDSLNLLQHTDFFIWAPGVEAMTVEKYTSSIDVLPTLANLFDLDAPYGLLTGDDAFSDEGGYVFFNDNTWVGSGEDLSAGILQRRYISGLLLSGNYWGTQAD